MSESVEFDSVEWITAGAVGEPGARTFFVQARQSERLVALLVEKGQVAGLAELAQEVLADFEVTVVPDDVDTVRYALVDDVEPLWRVGAMGLAASPGGERFMLELRELRPGVDEALAFIEEPEPATARFWMTQPQLAALAVHAAWSVEAGARPRCRLCGRPIEAQGHVCPGTNGHGPLTV